MPLHLLGKKSWNVYNADNVARVKRDEAAAKAAEEAEEQHMQEVDAERRLAILRGEIPPPLPERDESSEAPAHEDDSRGRYRGVGRKKRKRTGEDDTDFELRLANERDAPLVEQQPQARKPTSSAPITDRSGHIDLLGDARLKRRDEKNEEAEKEAQKKKRELEDQYTMRFSNAAGRNEPQNPWYTNSGAGDVLETGRDVWGNEDAGRKDRDAQRMVSNDPLAMMKQGASQVRRLKTERRRYQDERDDELRQLKKEQSRETSRSEAERRSRNRDVSPRGSDRRRRSSHREHGDEGSRRRRRRDIEQDDTRRRDRRRSRSPAPERRRHRHRHRHEE